MSTEQNLNLISQKEVSDLEKIMNLKYGVYLKNRYFLIKSEDTPNEIIASITLRDENKTFYYEVETKVSKKNLELETKEALFILLDYMDIYFDEYLKGEENVYIPIDWVDYTFENLTFQMRGQVKNLYAESLAETFLENNTVQPQAKILNYCFR